MPTILKTKNSVTTTVAPTTLQQGELAVNITDKKVWVGNAATTPVQLLGDGGSGSFTSIAFGAGTVSAPSITFTGDTNTGIYSPAVDTIAFAEGGVESMRITSAGGVQAVNCISVGNATPSASGAGITFPATQSASTDANTLDDYEEGTWTPVISGSITNPTVSYSTRAGYYTKVGRVVTIQCAIQPNVVSVPGVGNLQFTGLPFTSANLSDAYGVGNAGTNGDFSWGTNKTQLVFNITPNSTTISPRAMQNGVAEATIPVTNLSDSNKYLFFSITYVAA